MKGRQPSAVALAILGQRGLLCARDPVPAAEAGPAIAIYVESGRVPVQESERGPQIITAIWPDGRALWPRENRKGGAPLLSGSIPAQRVQALLKQFEDHLMLLFPQEADRLQHFHIGTGHVLLGLIELGHGTAIEALKRMGIDLESMRRAVEELAAAEPETGPANGHRDTPGLNRVIEFAEKEAGTVPSLQAGAPVVDTGHFLLGLLREGEGVAARVLRKSGVELERAREEILKERARAQRP